MNKKIKKALATVCIFAMSVSLLCGCGASKSEENKAVISGYEVSEGELMVYSLLTLLSGKQTYADIMQDEATFKQMVIEEIRENKIIYDMAMSEGMEFSDSDKETRDKLISSFKSYVPAEVRRTYNISDATIDEVFNVNCIVDKYENDKRNELGKEITAKYEEQYKDRNFQSLYHIMFPTIETDEDNGPKTGDDGNYIQLSDEEKEAIYEKAQAAAEEINSGKDAQTVAADYGVDIYSETQSGYVGMYTDELNGVLGSLDAGQCTQVYESEVGYYIIAVLTTNDQDMLESFAYSLALDDVDTIFNEQLQGWINAVSTETDAQINDGFWGDFNLLDMATDLYQRALLS